MYHFIGYHSNLCPDNKTSWSPELKWGYLAEQATKARFAWPQHEVYQNILKIIESKPEGSTYVISTNADGMFVQNGFDAARVYNPQGDYSHLQCLKPCKRDAYWPSQPILEEILPTIDSHTQTCSTSVVPRCPFCQGPAFFNVRGGNWFIEDVARHRADFVTFVKSTAGKRLVIVEVGVASTRLLCCAGQSSKLLRQTVLQN